MQSSRHDPKPRSAAAIALGELAIASCESAERPVRATGRAAVFRTIMVRALMTLCLLTFAAPAMAQVTVTVIEPVTAPLIDGGKVLYQRLAPDTPDGPERARISMRMRRGLRPLSAACSAAANFLACIGTTRSSVSAVVMSRGG